MHMLEGRRLVLTWNIKEVELSVFNVSNHDNRDPRLKTAYLNKTLAPLEASQRRKRKGGGGVQWRVARKIYFRDTEVPSEARKVKIGTEVNIC